MFPVAPFGEHRAQIGDRRCARRRQRADLGTDRRCDALAQLRLPELTPAAQAELGERLAAAVRAQVSPLPPPGTPPVAYLSAVLAERRNREQARLTAAPPEAVAAWRPPAGAAIQEPTAAVREGEAPGNEPPAVGGFVPPV